jgi:hypothetical protein
LELSHRGSDNGVWGGSYHGLQLTFSCLKSSQHLSLIEIDLK